MSYRRQAVSHDLVHLRHRDYCPTQLRLSPLQFRVLKFIQKGAALDADGGKSEPPALMTKRKEHIRVHRSTYRTLVHRGHVVKEDGRFVLSILAVAALEIYDL